MNRKTWGSLRGIRLRTRQRSSAGVDAHSGRTASVGRGSARGSGRFRVERFVFWAGGSTPTSYGSHKSSESEAAVKNEAGPLGFCLVRLPVSR